MPKIDFVELAILLAVITVVGAFYGFGPVLWLKRSAGKRRAQTGADREQLVERVRQLLPQANDDNVVFSLYKESRTHNGSQVSITTNTYYSKVYVVDGGQFWLVPISVKKGSRSYQLGQPMLIPPEAVKGMKYTGKRDKKLKCSFYLELDGKLEELEMVLAPCCVRENRFCPFDLLQKTACDRALETFEAMAQSLCAKTPEEMEEERLKDECTNYGIYAGCTGLLAIIGAFVPSVAFTVLFFAVALGLLGMIVVKKQVPKVSLVVVIVEMVIAYLLF